MGVSIRVRNGIIHLIIKYNGIRKEESTGLRVSTVKSQNMEVMRLAEILRSKKEIQLVQSFNGLAPEPIKITLYDYVKKCASGNDSLAGQIHKVLPYLERFDGKKIFLQAVTSAWFENFQNHIIKDTGLKSRHTQEKYCSVVRQCIKKAYRDGLILKDPCQCVKHIRTPDSHKEFLTEKEVSLMVKTELKSPRMNENLQNEVRKAFIFGCYTGLRISDIKQLAWENIDMEHKQIVKKQQKTQNYVYIPLNKVALSLINDNLPHEPKDLIFPFLAESRTTTNRYIHKWAEKAGIKKSVSWHSARHTNATLLIEEGADLYTVQRLLGHTKIATTMQYAVVSDRKKIDAVDSLPDFGIKDALE